MVLNSNVLNTWEQCGDKCVDKAKDGSVAYEFDWWETVISVRIGTICSVHI